MPLVTKISPLSGKTNTIFIPYKQEDFDAWQEGALIQNAMPYLSADEREFLMTGLTPEDWAKIFESE